LFTIASVGSPLWACSSLSEVTAWARSRAMISFVATGAIIRIPFPSAREARHLRPRGRS
jgi:hypothetical protein